MRKENQGLTEAGEFGQVPERVIWDAGQSSLPRKGPAGMPANLAEYLIFSLFIFRFLLSRVGAQKHTPHKRPGRGDLIYL